MENLSADCVQLCTSHVGTLGAHVKEETAKSLPGNDDGRG